MFFKRKKTKKPVFIHISKNAGTSIIRTASIKIVVAGHQTATSWIAKNGHEAPLFAVIRNPFDRVVSEYFFRKRRYDAGEKNPHLANLYKSFEDWVIATFRDGEFRTHTFFEQTAIPYNPKNMIDNTLIWFISQKEWIYNPSNEKLVDHILRYENLDSDWEQFSRTFHIHRDLAHHNKSPRKRNYQEYYSAQSRKVIEEYFQEDLETFGYLFH